MPAVVIVGAQWGDEGKGKIVDHFTEHAELVVRYAGGPNAGHTLVVGNDKVVVRLIPSGILRPATRCVLAQGMAIDPGTLLEEIDELTRRGHLRPGSGAADKLVVSRRAHAILPYHVAIDTLREQGAGALGTTKRGVGPCYEDKAARRGVTMGAFLDLGEMDRLVRRALEAWAPVATSLGGSLPSADSVMERARALQPRIAPLLAETSLLVDRALRDGKTVLLEGAQGALLDVDHGTYPFVTSSTATSGGACTGVGIGPTRIDRVIGLVKAYTTRVGAGPFPTELHDEVGERLRKVGAEFGSVTGRPRRCGWLDLPALRYATRINGLDGLALTKLDVLTGLDEIKVAVAYRTSAGESEEFPIDELARVGGALPEPVYRTFPGWKEELATARRMSELPAAARRYLDFIEEQAGCRLVLVSVGSRRDETIVVEEPLPKTSRAPRGA